MSFAAINASKGAITALYVAADPEIEKKGYNGEYFVPHATLATASKEATDEAACVETWKASEAILKKKFKNDWVHEV